MAATTVLALVLVGQGAWSFLAPREPYPAVRMPAFNGSADTAGIFPTTTLEITVHYADGTGSPLLVSDLVGDFRPTARQPSLANVFRPANNRTAPRPVDDPEVRAWLAERVDLLGDGRTASSVDFCWRTHDLDVRLGEYVGATGCDLMRVDL